MARIAFSAILFSVLSFSLGSSQLLVAGEVQYDFISHGEERGWLVDEGDSLLVFYDATGDSATLTFRQSWVNWFMNDPHVVINIWFSPAPVCGGKWYNLGSTSVDPWWRTFPLYLSRGTYCFEIKCYRNVAPVILKVD